MVQKKWGWEGGWSVIHWKQKPEPKQVKNVKGEKEILGCAKIFSNWKKYEELESRR